MSSNIFSMFIVSQSKRFCIDFQQYILTTGFQHLLCNLLVVLNNILLEFKVKLQ